MKIATKGEQFRFKNYGEKIKSPFLIQTDFESTLVPVDSGQQNSNEPNTNKYKKNVVCSYGYELMCWQYIYEAFSVTLG